MWPPWLAASWCAAAACLWWKPRSTNALMDSSRCSRSSLVSTGCADTSAACAFSSSSSSPSPLPASDSASSAAALNALLPSLESSRASSSSSSSRAMSAADGYLMCTCTPSCSARAMACVAAAELDAEDMLTASPGVRAATMRMWPTCPAFSSAALLVGASSSSAFASRVPDAAAALPPASDPEPEPEPPRTAPREGGAAFLSHMDPCQPVLHLHLPTSSVTCFSSSSSASSSFSLPFLPSSSPEPRSMLLNSTSAAPPAASACCASSPSSGITHRPLPLQTDSSLGVHKPQ
mmetsp:Transcript_9419/g.29680  ORF Transcript_9419/g.29680 Transcript_9419/m.29680 type:complete len:292 (+) Transcript_9419:438-1313(+)